MAIFDEKIEIRERCKGVHCVDLGESFPTRIYLQKSASIQPRTSPSKFGGKIQFNIHFTPRHHAMGTAASSGVPGSEAGAVPAYASGSGCGKLYRARSRLYRNEILQENMRLKALAEIYTMHSFALL